MKDVIWILSAVVIICCLTQFQSDSSAKPQFKKHYVKNFDSVGRSATYGMVAVQCDYRSPRPSEPLIVVD